MFSLGSKADWKEIYQSAFITIGILIDKICNRFDCFLINGMCTSGSIM